jgi:hypothetical protein
MFSLNDLCKHWQLSNADKQIAKNNIYNALKQINSKIKFNENSKLFISFVFANIIFKNNNDYYRIFYRKIDNNVINCNIKTFNVISKNDYGILSPLEICATDKYLYAKIKYVEHFQGATYSEIKNLLKKTLKLCKHGLFFTDLHPYNLGTLNNKPIIIDYDLYEEIEIKDIIRDAMKEFNIKSSSNTSEIMKTVKNLIDKDIGGRNCWFCICLIAKCKNFINALDFARIYLNDTLFCMKNNLSYGMFTKSRFEHLMDVKSYEI